MDRRLFIALAALAVAGPLAAQRPALAPQSLEVKYVRDAEEYATLTRMVYRMASASVAHQAAALPRGTVWAVVLDLDETVLDNSAYQLERAAYGLPFDGPSWAAWVDRAEAGLIPGVAQFIAGVRAQGGRVAWVSDRSTAGRAPTRAVLVRNGIWREDDLLCLKNGPADSTKARRRTEIATGHGECSWNGAPARILAFIGDQVKDGPGRGDFPGPGEPDSTAGTDSAFGTRSFIIPNPTYGSWTDKVTRREH
ncbi:MAG TPA: HAD family acid phosphatase [Gemmatimonadales bacterium]|nr:HAD family acid phosphatase [Gemmatimonadales bacterium]